MKKALLDFYSSGKLNSKHVKAWDIFIQAAASKLEYQIPFYCVTICCITGADKITMTKNTIVKACITSLVQYNLRQSQACNMNRELNGSKGNRCCFQNFFLLKCFCVNQINTNFSDVIIEPFMQHIYGLFELYPNVEFPMLSEHLDMPRKAILF